jgi:CubicO group peptidase (beta-lactamase class C family)
LHGFADLSTKQPVTAETLFEIGSVTKPLIGLASLSQVKNGQWAFERPIPALQAINPAHNYPLAALLTHRSGLPRLPANLPLQQLTNPYARYTTADLIQAIQQTEPGSSDFVYSNYGYGLLGYMLSSAMQQGLADILHQQVFTPLAMKNAALQLPGYQEPRLASGYALSGEPVEHWQFEALAGAGAVVATVQDMAQMLSSVFRLQQSDPKIRQWLTPLEVSGEPQMTPGWMLNKNWLWHSGQTAGFSSVVVFDPARKIGIVLLTNLGMSLNQQGFQLAEQWAQQTKKQDKKVQ